MTGAELQGKIAAALRYVAPSYVDGHIAPNAYFWTWKSVDGGTPLALGGNEDTPRQIGSDAHTWEIAIAGKTQGDVERMRQALWMATEGVLFSRGARFAFGPGKAETETPSQDGVCLRVILTCSIPLFAAVFPSAETDLDPQFSVVDDWPVTITPVGFGLVSTGTDSDGNISPAG